MIAALPIFIARQDELPGQGFGDVNACLSGNESCARSRKPSAFLLFVDGSAFVWSCADLVFPCPVTCPVLSDLAVVAFENCIDLSLCIAGGEGPERLSAHSALCFALLDKVSHLDC